MATLVAVPFLVVKDMRSVTEVNKECIEQISCGEQHSETSGGLSSVLWSECFKPRNSSEILGNSNCGSKLKNWLLEWKTLRERKVQAIQRHEEKKRKR